MKPHYRWNWKESKPILVCWPDRFGNIVVEPGQKVDFRHMIRVLAS